jgi:Ca-activated chloride channel family protein
MSEFFSMDFFTQFHFMRPEWLVLIIPAIIFTGMMLRQILRSGDWSKYIDPALQSYMLDDIPGKKSTAVSGVLAIAWIITIFALAGPSFEKKAVPVVTNPDALVILLDMSLSMGAQDVAPSRAVRAVRKATDIVRGREDGVTAVVAYAGDAHTVVPFTDDSATVEHLITSLSPEIMPKLGSRPDKAISNALKLMRDAGITEANILLLTDGIQEKDVSRISPLLTPNVSLSLIAIGTNEGAPIPTGDQGFLKDGSGNIVLPRLNTRPMQSLYEATGSRWRSLTYNDSDWQGLTTAPDYSKAKAEQEQMLQTWVDSGFWLIFLILPVALFSFRRGVVFTVLLIPFLMAPEPAMAGMWQTDDQQAAKELKRDPAAAAELFTDKAWRGTALYRAGKYDEAADAFNTLNSADAAFNRGNSLAMAGDLEGAIDAYEEALKKQPEFPAATKNLEQVKRHLEEQKEQEQQQQDSGDSSDEQNQDGEQGDQQDQQNSDSSSESNSDSNSDSNSENSQSDPSDQNSDSQESDSSESQQDPSDSEEGKKSDDEFAEQKAQEQAQEQKPAENSESSSAQDRDPNDKQPDAQADEQESNDSEAQAALEQEQPTNDAGDESDPEALDTFSNLSREERAAMDSLLNQVPDNPGLLMQRKFLYQYRQNTDQTEEDVLW